VSDLITPAYLDARRASGAVVHEPAGGTVYLCAVDEDRMAVSFIQSLFDGFGSGIVAPGTGVVLQNRGACFSVGGRVEPGRRPYHTIIPGMLLRDGELLGPFGVMGGFIQAQAHMQLVSAVVDDGLDPQAALDRPRFRVDGERRAAGGGLWDHEPDLQRSATRPPRTSRPTVRRRPGDLRDGRRVGRRVRPRKDGYAGGI
jgi:gamma-glutamyltranspeptidase/glutathione hydrolase